ncbi:MAG: hypothetical protein JW819_02765 [Candidatus Krumholzibacteriota bacterium]|nr:hypothetical protein [Candidatus Krumholzibacteriota bacterium]
MIHDREEYGTTAAEHAPPVAANPADATPPHADDGPHRDLLASWDRLFAIGPLYPPGNTRFTAVAGSLRTRMVGLLDGAPTLVVDVGRDFVVVQNLALPRESLDSRQLVEVLEALGVSRLEVDAGVDADDLHVFVLRIIALRRELILAKDFRHCEFEGLPAGFRLRQREFGLRQGEDGVALTGPGAAEAALERLLAGKDERELSEEERRACREQAGRILARLAERWEVGSGPDGRDFGRSLEEVLSLGIQAIEEGLGALAEAGPEGLAGFVADAERAVGLAADEESVRVLLDILREVSSEKGVDHRGGAEPVAAEGSDHFLDLDVLRQELDALGGAGDALDTLAPPDRAEYLSVLLRFLLESGEGKAAPPRDLAAQLAECLAGEASPREAQVLVMALGELLARGDTSQADRILPLILGPLRADGTVLARLLLALGEDAGPDAQEALWPHLVDVVLLGATGGDAGLQRRLHRLAASLEPARALRALRRLEHRDALLEGRLATQLLRPPPQTLYPVFALLLRSSRAPIVAGQLQEGLRARPPSWITKGLLDLPASGASRQRDLLTAVLRGREDPEGLHRAEGATLREALGALPRERRDEPWVGAMLARLAAHPGKATEALLERVRRERRRLLWAAWPAPCRRAAAGALQALRVEAGGGEDGP